MCVCLSVTGLYGFTHSLHTFLASAAHAAITTEDSEDRRQQEQAREQVQRYKRRLTAQQWNERRQDMTFTSLSKQFTLLTDP